MAPTIYPGFVGSVNVGDLDGVRCTDFSLNVNQEPLFYDHTIGLRDSIPADLRDVKGDTGEYNQQKLIWRPSVKLSQGSFGFIWTDYSAGALWEQAKTGDDFDMEFYYTCGIGRKFTGCKVNQYSFRASAGDIVNATVDIVSKHITNLDASEIPKIERIEKIITWDVVEIAIDGYSSSQIVNLDFTINNACAPIYTAGNNISASLEAKEIRVGMQSLTGSVSFYLTDDINYMENISAPKKMFLSTPNWSSELNIIMRPMQQTSSTGAIIRTYMFNGVDYNVEP